MNDETKVPVVLAFDLGKDSAWWVSSRQTGTSFKINDLKGLEEQVNRLIDYHKPDVILYPHPVRYFNVARKHFQYIGIINLCCEKSDIQSIEVTDSSAKKVVLGNGKAKKEQIMEFFKEKNEHVADARMFVEWYFKKTE